MGGRPSPRQIQRENATLLDAHPSRIEDVDRELSSLRAELERRVNHTATTPLARLLPPPRLTPLRIPRTVPGATNSQTTTTWLLRRVGQLEDEARSAWREFLGRFALLPRRAT
jgi:hypothetical protein